MIPLTSREMDVTRRPLAARKRSRGIALILISCLVIAAGAEHASAVPRIKVIKISVANPSQIGRPASDVVVSIASLRTIAPDFAAGAFVVVATDASSIAEDDAKLVTEELPSQADDFDGDGLADEIAFQIDLGPKQTRVVTIAYGEPATIQRLRAEYPRRTEAAFAKKYEGVRLGVRGHRLADRFSTPATRSTCSARSALDFCSTGLPRRMSTITPSPRTDATSTRSATRSVSAPWALSSTASP